jgi:hypothetical protein
LLIAGKYSAINKRVVRLPGKNTFGLRYYSRF